MEQQEQRTSVRLVVVDPDLEAQCDRVEEHLLAPLAETVGGAGGDHALFADGLVTFRRVRETLAEAVARGPKVRTPNGRWEHEGLRLVELPTGDTDLLYALLRELSGLLVAPPDLPDPSGVVATVRTTVLTPEKTAVGLVGALARVLSLVDLTPDADTATLFAAIEAGGGEDVRLSYGQDEAWQRLAHRLTMLLTESAPLHRFLY
ncbi:hypothetical protein OG601_03300 [Streptomyces sp. NBC_01239]|uniref:hypothetical protein n=1 Tax=Streptomyces sp. NBC_01239 TaxID=2903792 RepID=UPI002259DB20|nr:hypothetical protein [Streptomyces sp. NBC_01239]MCX4809649.1 hypothetical protein [Streptomyces sp. NBC_01239]